MQYNSEDEKLYSYAQDSQNNVNLIITIATNATRLACEIVHTPKQPSNIQAPFIFDFEKKLLYGTLDTTALEGAIVAVDYTEAKNQWKNVTSIPNGVVMLNYV